jgi:FKBP-type peptidyl-prolyl cis-trans isomerase FkpA
VKAFPSLRAICTFFAAVAVAAPLTACGPDAPPVLPESQVTTLEVTDIVQGTGAEATAGDRVTVHYTGWLYEQDKPESKGTEFDSSRKGGKPFTFELGAGNVIAGWDQGVAGMRVGGQRRLTIPAALGYGNRGAGGVIPPGATLLFDVELLEVAGK